MRLLVLNGANLNMLGIREPQLYGDKTYADLENYIKEAANEFSVNVEIFQSNYEGDLIEAIHSSYKIMDGIIINAGAFSHTSLAILDALKAVGIPTVEVHLTDISKREEYRRFSYISEIAQKVFVGEGFLGYKKAIEFFANDNIKRN